MAAILADVIRVEGSITGVFNAVRAKQVGFENEGNYRQIHKLVDNTCHHWTPDEYRTMGATGVTYLNSSYPTFGDVQDALDYLLRPDLKIMNMTVDQAVKGQSITSVTTSWGVTGSLLTMTLVDAHSLPGSLDVATVTYPYSYPTGIGGVTGSYAFTLTITDSAGSVANTSYLYFKLGKYYGTSASATPTEGIIEAGVETLCADTAASKTLSSRSVAGGGNYIYYAYPASWGALTSLLINGFSSTWNITTVSVTNSQGNVENYTVYTSPYTISGTITIAAS